MKRNCKQVTISISKLKKAFYEFESNLDSADSDNVENLIQKSKDLKKLVLETQCEVISPVRPFLEELGKPETIEKIKAIAQQVDLANEEKFQQVSALFNDLPEELVVDDDSYQDFLREFDSQTETMQSLKEVAVDANYNIINHLNSAFLNKFMKQETILSVGELPENFNYYGFGSYLEKGTIKLKNAERGLGHKAENTTFIAERAMDHVGVHSYNCRFIVGNITGDIVDFGSGVRVDCQNFFGDMSTRDEKATISVENGFHGMAGILVKKVSLFCNYNSHAVYNYDPSNTFVLNDVEKCFANDTPGVTLLNHQMETPLISQRSFYYDDLSSRYLSQTDPEFEPKVLKDVEEIVAEVSDFKGNGVGMIDDYSGFRDDQNPCSFIANGILILRKLDDRFPLGENTTGGAIIIDIPGLSPEEVKQKISKNRPGGLVLMRVPELGNPGRTLLIDLENDSLGKMEENND